MTRRFSVLLILLAGGHALIAAQPATPSGPIVTAQTPHLSLMAVASDAAAVPGQRLSLIFDVTPQRNIHVYAAGKHTYQVVRITLDSRPWLRVHPTTYPPSTIYHFKPLDERVPVYQKPFQLVQDVTVLATPAAKKALAGQKSVTIAGRLDYQACNDTLCFRPQSVPVTWTLPLRTDLRPRG